MDCKNRTLAQYQRPTPTSRESKVVAWPGSSAWLEVSLMAYRERPLGARYVEVRTDEPWWLTPTKATVAAARAGWLPVGRTVWLKGTRYPVEGAPGWELHLTHDGVEVGRGPRYWLCRVGPEEYFAATNDVEVHGPFHWHEPSEEELLDVDPGEEEDLEHFVFSPTLECSTPQLSGEGLEALAMAESMLRQGLPPQTRDTWSSVEVMLYWGEIVPSESIEGWVRAHRGEVRRVGQPLELLSRGHTDRAKLHLLLEHQLWEDVGALERAATLAEHVWPEAREDVLAHAARVRRRAERVSRWLNRRPSAR